MRLAAAVVAVLLLGGCGGGRKAAPEGEAPAGTAAQAPVTASPSPAPPAPLPKATVTLWFPSATTADLVPEPREIVDTVRPTERGTQILAALLDGPKTDAALPALPAGTTLRQLWVRPDGVAWADFSSELAQGMDGGSEDELFAVYAIVDSLALNVPGISRVGILVDGHERDTLGGHVNLRLPLPPDRKAPPPAP